MEPIPSKPRRERPSIAEPWHLRKDLSTLLSVIIDISSELNLDELLHKIIHHATELCDGDAGTIALIDEAGSIVKRYPYNAPEVIARLETPYGKGALYEAIEKRKTVIVDDYPNYPRRIESFVVAGVKSLIVTPIMRKGKITGVMEILNLTSKKKFTRYHAGLLEAVAGQAAVAIENSRLYEAQRHISESLQRSMLPAFMPQIPDMELGVRYSSATEEALVGGDFYDIYDLDGKYALVIGDVSGKGIEASSSTSMMKYILRAYLYQNPSPSFAMSQANDFFRRQAEKASFITTFCAVYDPKTSGLTFVNAGHPYPCLLNQILKTCTVLSTDDPAIGLLDHYKYRENTVVMNPGNVFVAYTDGVIEARLGKDFFGDKRLVETFLDNLDKPAQNIANSIINATLLFTHGKLTDDIALLILRKIR